MSSSVSVSVFIVSVLEGDVLSEVIEVSVGVVPIEDRDRILSPVVAEDSDEVTPIVSELEGEEAIDVSRL